MATIANILYAGDTLEFTTSTPDFPAGSGWTLKIRLAPRATGVEIDIASTADGDDHLVSVPATTTAAWSAGWYTATVYVEKGAERYTLERVQVEVRAASTTLADGSDGRGQAERAVDDLKAALATYTASRGIVAEYAINGRSMKFRDSGEIVALLNYWEAELSRERAAESVAKGLGNPRRLFVRFG